MALPFTFDTNNPPMKPEDVEALKKAPMIATAKWAEDLGHSMVESITIDIGGKHYVAMENGIQQPDGYIPLKFQFEHRNV